MHRSSVAISMAGTILIAILLMLGPAAGAAAAPAKVLQALFEREFRWRLEQSPEYATFVGVDDYNDRLSDLSPAAIARRKEHAKALLGELERLDARPLDATDRVSRALLLEEVRTQTRFDDLYGSLPFTGSGGWMMVSPVWGPQFLLPQLAKAAPFRNARDYDKYLRRLAQVPRAIEQTIALMREGMRTGWTPPREAMNAVPAQFDALIVEDPQRSPLFAPFHSFPSALPDAERSRLAAQAQTVIAGQVQPALARLKRFVADEYLNACRPTIAATDLPAGPAYYALLVREATTTSMTPAAIHALGLREVDRIAAEMDRLVAGTRFAGTRSQFAQSIKADKRFYFTDPQELLKTYRDIAKRVDAELPKLFAELPRLPYGVRAMERSEGDNADHYTPGALDGSRAGYFEANVYSLATRPRYQMENTFLHEAVPGHHLQVARAQERKDLPALRRTGFFTAYVEGWALYAESLGPELGLYKDPYSRFGALSWEMMRACRLVVDTGIHTQGWSRAQAIGYLVDNAFIADGYAAAEVDRYIVWPAQALAYKIGELKIKELKARAQSALGERFDIRHFHNAVLDDGALPLTVLESRIDEWIASQAKPASH